MKFQNFRIFQLKSLFTKKQNKDDNIPAYVTKTYVLMKKVSVIKMNIFMFTTKTFQEMNGFGYIN